MKKYKLRDGFSVYEPYGGERSPSWLSDAIEQKIVVEKEDLYYYKIADDTYREVGWDEVFVYDRESGKLSVQHQDSVTGFHLDNQVLLQATPSELFNFLILLITTIYAGVLYHYMFGFDDKLFDNITIVSTILYGISVYILLALKKVMFELQKVAEEIVRDEDIF